MPSEKQYLERRENIAAIVQYLRFHTCSSRRQIADALDLSWGCVSELVLRLLSQNILLEEELAGSKTKGRVPSVLKLNPDICFLGVDINKNGLNACICDLLGQKVTAYTDSLPYHSKEELLNSVRGFVKHILSRHTNIFGIGFAMQGIFHRNRRVWEFSSDPAICIDFEADIRPGFDIPVVVDHDPNCILYGALDNTQARKMILRLDKGIGAAVYTGNDFMRNDLLEVAALVVNEQGQRLRDVVSLEALEHASDPSVFRQAGMYLGITLGNLCNLLNLDEILICGKMTAFYTQISPALNDYYEQTALPAQKAAITPVAVTDAAYGAAKMAMDQFHI